MSTIQELKSLVKSFLFFKKDLEIAGAQTAEMWAAVTATQAYKDYERATKNEEESKLAKDAADAVIRQFAAEHQDICRPLKIFQFKRRPTTITIQEEPFKRWVAKNLEMAFGRGIVRVHEPTARKFAIEQRPVDLRTGEPGDAYAGWAVFQDNPGGDEVAVIGSKFSEFLDPEDLPPMIYRDLP